MKRNKANNYARTEAAIKWCFAENMFFLYLINYTIELSCWALLAIGEVFGERIDKFNWIWSKWVVQKSSQLIECLMQKWKTVLKAKLYTGHEQ